MKTASITCALAVASTLLLQPAIADPFLDAARAAHVAYAPESPAAAFERMLAHAPVTAAPLVQPVADPLDPHFHAALWTGTHRGATRTAKLQ